MRSRLALVVALAASTLIVLTASPAFAQTPGAGIDNNGVAAGLSVPGGNGTNNATITPTAGGTSGGGSGGGGGSSEPATSHWTRHYYGESSDSGYGINAPFICPNGQNGFEDVQTDNASGAVLNRSTGCAAIPVPGGPAVPAPPPPPPPPPTAAEVRNLTPIPNPGWGISPVGTGLTGLATWLYDSNGATPRTATAVIRGYTVTSTARPQRWVWDMAASGPSSRSNPPSVVSSSTPGTADHPAVTYTYETGGSYGLTLTTTWGGSFTYTRPGDNPVTSDLGTTTRTANRSYTVGSIQPVVVASRA